MPTDAAPASPASTSASPALLVTSAASRSNYASNVNTLNTAVSNAATTNANTPPTTQSTGVDTNYFLKAGETIPQYNARISQYNSTKDAATTATANGQTTPAATPTPPATGSGGADPALAARVAGGTYTGADGQQYYSSDGSPAAVASGATPAGTTVATGTQGDDNTAPASLTSGLDPSAVSAFNQNYSQLSQQANDAQATLASAKANAANDPALAAAISQIQSQFGQLITKMTQQNAQVLGRANTAAAAFGGLGQMSQSFLNDEQQGALSRITDLQNEEQSAVLKMQSAYQANDIKAVADATTAYQNALSAKTKAISDLQTATNNAAKTLNEQQKTTMAAQKQQQTLDVSNSTKLAAGIVQQLQQAGINDASGISQEDIQGLAEQNGISDPSLLYSAVVSAFASANKAATGIANTQSEIAARNSNAANNTTRTQVAAAKAGKTTTSKGGGTDGTYNYTAADKSFYTSILTGGATLKDGTKLNAQGSDGFVDPNAYLTALQSWESKGGTPAGFAKVFSPKKLVNPASYSELPDAIRPPTKASATATAAIPQ